MTTDKSAVVALVALILTAAAGLGTAGMIWGSTKSDISQLQKRMDVQAVVVLGIKSDAQVTATNGAMESQALSDIVGRLDRIERKLDASVVRINENVRVASNQRTTDVNRASVSRASDNASASASRASDNANASQERASDNAHIEAQLAGKKNK